MSTAKMIDAWDAIETDSRLTALDKLVLLRWAWKSRDEGETIVIRFKTFARALNSCPKAVKRSVLRLAAFGLLKLVSVQAKAGPKLAKGGSQTPPRENKGGVTDHPRGGSRTTPKGGHRPPLTEQKYKKGARDAGAGGKKSADLSLEDVGRYGRSCLREGKPLVAGGVHLKPESAEFGRLAELLRNEQAQGVH